MKKIISGIIITIVFGLVLLTNTSIKADDVNKTNDLTILGAQVRTTGNVGIRFVVELDEGTTLTPEKYGLMMAYGAAEVSDSFVVGATINGKETKSIEMDADGDNRYYVTIIEIPEEAYTNAVTVRAFVIDDGVTYYSNDVATRSLAQVVNLAANNGETSVVQSDVHSYIDENKKMVYEDKVGNLRIMSSIRETRADKLAEMFTNDWDKFFGGTTDIIRDVNNANFTSKLKSNLQGASEFSSSCKLAQFFRDEDMNTKWGWLLAFIGSEGTSNGALTAQIRAVTGENESINSSNWYYGLSIISRIGSFFIEDYYSAGTAGLNFSLYPGSYAKLGTTYLTPFIESYGELVEVGDNVTISTSYSAPAYYEHVNFKNVINESYVAIGSTYEVTSSDVLFSPQISPINYTIIYKDGDNTLDLSPSSYNVETLTFDLPSYNKDGYVFEGWYDNSEFEGSAITSVEKGSHGNKTFYAKTIATANVRVTATFNANGGMMNSSVVSATPARNITVSTYSNTGGASGTYLCSTAVTTNNSLRWQYKILLEYNSAINAYKVVATDAAKKSANAAAEEAGVTWTHALSNASTNISTYATVGQYIILSEDDLVINMDSFTASVHNESAFTSVNIDLIEPETLPVPIREGYTFNGWLCNLDDTIYTVYPGYTSDPGELIYTAQWIAN